MLISCAYYVERLPINNICVSVYHLSFYNHIINIRVTHHVIDKKEYLTFFLVNSCTFSEEGKKSDHSRSALCHNSPVCV